MTAECHQIDMSNNRANIAYAGQKPWHGLGAELTPGATIEEWTRQAGLEFDVRSGVTAFLDEVTGKFTPIDDRVTLYRSDTRKALGIVSPRYKAVQPHAVVEFFRSFVEAGDMHLETAGALNGGKRVWALATNGRTIRVQGNDVVRPYLLLSTTFDGSTATVAHFTTVRVVCNNTMQMSVRLKNSDERNGAKSFISVPHRQTFDAEQVKQDLDSYRQSIDQFEKQADLLAGIKVADDDAVMYFTKLVGKLNEEKKLSKQSSDKIATLLTLYKTGPGANLRSADGTAWGLINAITHFTDHQVSERREGSRLESAWYGAGRSLKEQALEAALELAA